MVLGAEKAAPESAASVPVDPVEAEYHRLLELDDAALTKIDTWLRASQRPDAKETETIALGGKIQAAITPVKDAYERFIQHHPNHARVRLTYASFLTDTGAERDALPHLEKAVELDPKLPAAWNNLANYHGHHGQVKKAFGYYEKAIEISPKEAVYYHNFGTTVFLFRKDVKEHYGITETEVFDKALALYAKALEMEPNDFDLAEDIAQTYYGIRASSKGSKMARPKEALKAWEYALKLAPGDFERQGIQIHLARTYLDLQSYEQARQALAKVDLPVYRDLRNRVGRRVPGYEPAAAPTDTTKD